MKMDNQMKRLKKSLYKYIHTRRNQGSIYIRRVVLKIKKLHELELKYGNFIDTKYNAVEHYRKLKSEAKELVEIANKDIENTGRERILKNTTNQLITSYSKNYLLYYSENHKRFFVNEIAIIHECQTLEYINFDCTEFINYIEQTHDIEFVFDNSFKNKFKHTKIKTNENNKSSK